MQCSASSTASRLSRLAAMPEGMMSGFFLTCRFGGCDSCSFCDLGGSGKGFDDGGGSEVCFTGCCCGGGGGGGDMLLDRPATGGQLARWWWWRRSGGDLEWDYLSSVRVFR